GVILTSSGCRRRTEPAAAPPEADDAVVLPEVTLVIAPEFSLMDTTGRKVSLADFEGSMVVLEWTSYQCPFVDNYYMPGAMVMIETAQKHANRNVIWLAINSSHTATAATNEEWRRKHRIPYPVLDDSLGTVGRMYGATHTPHMFVLDKERRVIYSGALDNDPERKMQPSERINYVDRAIGEYFQQQPISIPRTRAVGCTVKYAPASAAVERPN
ncbi:MAG TPA: redoxin domain-containing protein, partial [Sedimentisphaerales bacterium]|nr:redoxin domain-containing protein [Sedimentisphaerales bacterium]